MAVQKTPRDIRHFVGTDSAGTLACVGAGPIASGEWLIADIGGTHARFATWTDGGGVTGGGARYRNDEFADLPALIDRYRNDIGRSIPRCLLALALPLSSG